MNSTPNKPSSVDDFSQMQKLGTHSCLLMMFLGEGAYSQVYRVKRISEGTEYAMKKVKMVKLSEREKQNALNEVRILASIQHPNIIGYKEAFFEESTQSLCIIMEFADGGDLLKLISNHKKRNIFINTLIIRILNFQRKRHGTISSKWLEVLRPCMT